MNKTKQPMSLSQELIWRGFYNQTTFSKPEDIDKQQLTFYFGVDPSAASMTIGNLAAAMMCRVFLKHGHKAIILIGGATGLIGDPDGKKDERNLKTLEQVAEYKKGIVEQYKTVFKGFDFEVVDNYDWFKNLGYLEFLRDVGKHVPMRQMLNREFVQSRVSEGGSGISYAEFSYSLIQGYDFLHLSKNHGVNLQLCGADQWGNCIAGVDLTRRITGKEVNVWSTPLVVNKSTGVKFGKSEEGAVWLNPELTSPFKFYQFWLNLDDSGVEEYLKIYTDLPKVFIDDLIKKFNEDKSKRLAQRTLAYEVTEMIHGKDTAESVKRVSKVLFGDENYQSLTKDDVTVLKNELKVVSKKAGDSLVDTLVEAELSKSKGEARRFIESKAVYINGQQIDSVQDLSATSAIHGCIVLRRGKNSLALVELN